MCKHTQHLVGAFSQYVCVYAQACVAPRSGGLVSHGGCTEIP